MEPSPTVRRVGTRYAEHVLARAVHVAAALDDNYPHPEAPIVEIIQILAFDWYEGTGQSVPATIARVWHEDLKAVYDGISRAAAHACLPEDKKQVIEWLNARHVNLRSRRLAENLSVEWHRVCEASMTGLTITRLEFGYPGETATVDPDNFRLFFKALAEEMEKIIKAADEAAMPA